MTLLVAGLWSCSDEGLTDSAYSRTDERISLNVGVEGLPGVRITTRAGEPSLYAMQEGTQIRLKVDGIWKRISPTVPVSQKTTCNTVAPALGEDVNALSFTDSEILFWDDFGTGDPDNAESRANGLAILGVAVDGKGAAPVIADDAAWESLAWDVVTDGNDVLGGDIIVSNNLNAYKFAQRNDAGAGKMVFVHPLSKITVNLKAGEGFTEGSVGATSFKFKADPTVTLTNATTLAAIADPANDYALTSGTVSIRNASAMSDGTRASVTAGTTCTTDAGITVIKQAVVYPGTQLGADDDAVIAVLNADDNIYYIKAKEIHDAITAKGGHTEFRTLAGYNYILNITVNKTGIRLTATVTDWSSVNSDEVYPVINVDTHVGDMGAATPTEFTSFAFWRSETIDADYQHEATPVINNDGTTDWSSTNRLYWTNHSQHYHFRGIFPVNTVVKTVNSRQVVEVVNSGYDANAFPSNFVMSLPEFSGNDYMCHNDDHTPVDMRQEGICARTSAINMNFGYMMSRVEVNLSSSTVGDDDYVDLTYAKADLLGVGTEGEILLSDRSAVVTTDGQEYAMSSVGGSSVHYHDAVIPQTLRNNDSSNKVRFRITVYRDDTRTGCDIYYADVAPVKVRVAGAQTSAPVDAWESGMHYVYNLKVTKTEIKTTATLTDWTTVEASEDVWF